MSIDNTDDTCSGGDLNSNVRELLFELRSQKTEINLLKEEIRGSTLSVASEVKKLKTDKSIAWRFQGNRLQFEFNSEVEDNLKQVLWAIENGKKEYAVELINESCEKLKTRNKHIRIADSSEGGWETVNQYVVNPLADDSEDESRLNRAESRAVRKKKNQKSKSKTKALLLWVLLILSIRVCGAVWERNQGRSLSSFSSRQSGHGLVPFVATHSQESTREASSLSARALPVERQTTFVETVRIPEPHQHSSNPSQLPRSEAVTTGESPDFDIEDEYSLYTDFDHDRFTENYFEYEQGQKDIIVKKQT